MINFKKILLIIVPLVIIIAGGGIWYLQSQNQLTRGNKDLSSDWTAKIEKKQNPSWQEIRENGPILITMDNLVFTNFDTGKKKEYDIFNDLAHSEINSYLKEIPVPVQYYLYANILEWSEDKSVLTGNIELFPSADPPEAVKKSYFKITLDTWSIEKLQYKP